MIQTKTPEKYVTYFSAKPSVNNALPLRNQTDSVPPVVSFVQDNKRIAIPSQNEVVFVKLKNIIGFEANGNYTKIHLVSEKQYLICQTLRKFEDRLKSHLFMRFNRKWLINILLINRYVKRDRCVIMNSGLSVSLSDKHRANFFCTLNNPLFLW